MTNQIKLTFIKHFSFWGIKTTETKTLDNINNN